MLPANSARNAPTSRAGAEVQSGDLSSSVAAPRRAILVPTPNDRNLISSGRAANRVSGQDQDDATNPADGQDQDERASGLKDAVRRWQQMKQNQSTVPSATPGLPTRNAAATQQPKREAEMLHTFASEPPPAKMYKTSPAAVQSTQRLLTTTSAPTGPSSSAPPQSDVRVNHLVNAVRGIAERTATTKLGASSSPATVPSVTFNGPLAFEEIMKAKKMMMMLKSSAVVKSSSPPTVQSPVIKDQRGNHAEDAKIETEPIPPEDQKDQPKPEIFAPDHTDNKSVDGSSLFPTPGDASVDGGPADGEGCEPDIAAWQSEPPENILISLQEKGNPRGSQSSTSAIPRWVVPSGVIPSDVVPPPPVVPMRPASPHTVPTEPVGSGASTPLVVLAGGTVEPVAGGAETQAAVDAPCEATAPISIPPTPAKELQAKEQPAPEVPAKEPLGQESPAKELPAKEPPAREPPAREPLSNEPPEAEVEEMADFSSPCPTSLSSKWTQPRPCVSLLRSLQSSTLNASQETQLLLGLLPPQEQLAVEGSAEAFCAPILKAESWKDLEKCLLQMTTARLS